MKKFFFFNCSFAAPRPTFGHYHENSLTHPIFDPSVTRKPRNEVGSLSQAERLVWFEPGTFIFWLQWLNPLGHSGLGMSHNTTIYKKMVSKMNY